MKVAAFDFGTKMGFAIKTHKGSIKSGTLKLHNKQWDGAGMRFVKFRRWLQENCADCDYICYEAVERHIGTATYAQHIYGGWLSELQAFCEIEFIPYTGLGVQTIKKAWTGSSRAKKADMVRVAREKGFNPKEEDEADALATLFCFESQFPDL